jgi:hypothetical protein
VRRGELSGRVDDGEDFHELVAGPVDDAKVAVKDLANVIACRFRNDSARLGELVQAVTAARIR